MQILLLRPPRDPWWAEKAGMRWGSLCTFRLWNHLASPPYWATVFTQLASRFWGR
jgi:hypothetical protein